MTRLYTTRGSQQLALFPGARPERESQANRGKAFERALDEMHELYERMGWAVIRHNYVKSTVVGDGKFARVDGSAIVDYSGTIAPRGRHVAFDAKDCEDNVISLSRLAQHQAAHLLSVHAAGGAAFILVRFEGRRVYRIPAWEWSEADRAHRYGLKDDYIGWRPTGKASIRMDELPQAWKLDGYDWLKGLER